MFVLWDTVDAPPPTSSLLPSVPVAASASPLRGRAFLVPCQALDADALLYLGTTISCPKARSPRT